MGPVETALVVVAAVFVVGALGESVFRRTGLPDVIWLIVAGALLGPVAGLVRPSDLIGVAPLFAAITLVVVLFEGGSHLDLRGLTSSIVRALSLSFVGFAFVVLATTLLVAIASAVGLLPASWGPLHGVMLGSILGGSSSVVIMPAMGLARVEPRVSDLVSLESAFTDVYCVVGASVTIDLLLVTGGGDGGAASPGLALAGSFGIALGLGLAGGLAWVALLDRVARDEHGYTHTLAALLGLYVLAGELGGSPPLAVLTFAIVVGNAPTVGRLLRVTTERRLGVELTAVHGQIAFIIKSFFFTFIGLMLGPPWELMAIGLGAGVALYLLRRLATRVALAGKGWSPAQRDAVAACLPRGLAAGVLATLPAARGVPDTEHLPPFVFAAVVTTIVVFAAVFPRARRRLTAEAGPPADAPTPSEPR
ncbi:MAG: cation:proton antiporter [Deltaproteobacteria bacterium]|nr:cation:proton antiporter [Deltaproteobacteria bacterium]